MRDDSPWPFGHDARRDDPLTEHRIAVTSSHPGWRFLVAFHHESEVRPTDVEVAMLVSYLNQYKSYWYGASGYRKQMERRLLDVDGGANGVVFHKYGQDDWGYRRQSWVSGPIFVPQHPRIRGSYPDDKQVGPLTLSALMDHIHTYVDEVSPRWAEWKAQHPEVFGS